MEGGDRGSVGDGIESGISAEDPHQTKAFFVNEDTFAKASLSSNNPEPQGKDVIL